MSQSPAPASPADSELIPVAHYGEEGEAMERALVVLAMNSESVVDPTPDGGFDVLAEPARAERAKVEIAAFDEETSQPVAPAPPLPQNSPGLPAAFLWAMSLMVTFLWQGENGAAVDRLVSSPQALAPAWEWWRPITSLFLHADIEHLLGNLGLGILLGLWCGNTIGKWRGWILMLAAGAVGNFFNILVRRGEDFSSLGASTAVFGALGLLTGAGLWHSLRHPIRRGWLRPLVPLFAGLILLSWLGAGGPRTDVSAHLLGFAFGLVMAPVAMIFSPRPSSTQGLADGSR
ncbi:MAG: rhomboid family intramembrane serine protease [Verrucomicrobiales bacterium]